MTVADLTVHPLMATALIVGFVTPFILLAGVINNTYPNLKRTLKRILIWFV